MDELCRRRVRAWREGGRRRVEWMVTAKHEGDLVQYYQSGIRLGPVEPISAKGRKILAEELSPEEEA